MAGDFVVRVVDGEYVLQDLVSISTGTKEQLMALPGIGPKIAQAVIAHREMHRAFTTVEGLKEVPMIGQKKFAVLRTLVVP